MCMADGVRNKEQAAFNKAKREPRKWLSFTIKLGSRGPKAKTNRTLFLNQNLRGCSNETQLEMLWSEVRNRQAMAMTLQELWRDGNETLLWKGCMLITNGLTVEELRVYLCSVYSSAPAAFSAVPVVCIGVALKSFRPTTPRDRLPLQCPAWGATRDPTPAASFIPVRGFGGGDLPTATISSGKGPPIIRSRTRT
jgi:hypothetical protein